MFSCQMDQYSNGGLNTGLKKACLLSKLLGIQMVRQVMWRPFDYLDTQSIRYSEESGVWMFTVCDFKLARKKSKKFNFSSSWVLHNKRENWDYSRDLNSEFGS